MIFRLLLSRFGAQGWWPADTSFEVCMGAILTQNTSWENARIALKRIDEAGIGSPEGLFRISDSDLGQLIYSSGYFNQKTRSLKALANHILLSYGGNVDAMFLKPLPFIRQELLAIHGIGDETADDILLYAGKLPAFVIDSYTRRIISRVGMRSYDESYMSLQAFFSDHLPPDVAMFNEYHALLVRLGKEVCLKQHPVCNACPLLHDCNIGRYSTRWSRHEG